VQDVDYTHPVMTRSGDPERPTQHLAVDFIKKYQARGHIKRCAHVKAVPVHEQSRVFYKVVCEARSFDVRGNPSGIPTDPMKVAFYGCPRNCLLFRSMWVENLARSCRSGGATVSAVARAIERQPNGVKITLVLGLVALIVLPILARYHELSAFANLIRTSFEVWRAK